MAGSNRGKSYTSVGRQRVAEDKVSKGMEPQRLKKTYEKKDFWSFNRPPGAPTGTSQVYKYTEIVPSQALPLQAKKKPKAGGKGASK